MVFTNNHWEVRLSLMIQDPLWPHSDWPMHNLGLAARLHSLKLTVRTWNQAIPKGNNRIPTRHFGCEIVSFLEGITCRNLIPELLQLKPTYHPLGTGCPIHLWMASVAKCCENPGCKRFPQQWNFLDRFFSQVAVKDVGYGWQKLDSICIYRFWTNHDLHIVSIDWYLYLHRFKWEHHGLSMFWKSIFIYYI